MTIRQTALQRIGRRVAELDDAHGQTLAASKYRAARETVGAMTADDDGYSSHLAAEHYQATGHLPRWLTAEMLRRGETA